MIIVKSFKANDLGDLEDDINELLEEDNCHYLDCKFSMLFNDDELVYSALVFVCIDE